MTRRATGHAVRTPPGNTAFVPDPLPPRVRFAGRLVRARSDAGRAIGDEAT
jgi:hypothetical protein